MPALANRAGLLEVDQCVHESSWRDNFTAAMNLNAPAGIPLENGTDLLILLLFAPGKSQEKGEAIEGITRLQKLMFLLRQGLGPRQVVELAKMYGYKPYKMGPYSSELVQSIDELVAAGILRTERLDYWIRDDSDEETAEDDLDAPERRKKVESSRFMLTPDLGMQVGADLWSSLAAADQKQLEEFKAFFNALSLRQLLIFAYERFPEYTTASVIKSQLGLS